MWLRLIGRNPFDDEEINKERSETNRNKIIPKMLFVK